VTAQTLALADFLLARIAEDEEAADGSLEYGEGRWKWVDPFTDVKQALVDERGRTVLPSALGDVYPSVSVAEHIARHDPARVLAEVEAKRQILADLTELQDWDVKSEDVRGKIAGLLLAAHALALPYADHPDFNPDWR
jgi:hypothetical protein